MQNDSNDFITEEEQLQRYLDANKKQTRRKRGGQQQPPQRKHAGRPRQHVAQEDVIVDDDDLLIVLSYPSSAADGTDHKQRVQQLLQGFKDSRHANAEMLCQFEAHQESEDQLRELSLRVDLANERILSAVARHPCCRVLNSTAAEACIGVVSRRTVAYHDDGAAHWIELPTINCLACNSTWELKPADLGCFGNTPQLPGALFTKKLLQKYRFLVFENGMSTGAYADACNSTAAVNDLAGAAELSKGPPGYGPILSMNAR